MIPEPKQDSTLLIVIGLIAVLVVALGAYIFLTPPEETEEQDSWIAEEGPELSPNATAVIVLPEECMDCASSLVLLENLQKDWAALGTNIVESNAVYDTSEEGRNMVIRYEIEKLPALVLKKESQWDSRILSTWMSDIGTVEDDGALVQREVVPPYYDTTTDEVKGKVEFVFLTDNTCENCYNVSAFAGDMISIFQMNVKNYEEYDISSVEGSAIVSKYDIKTVPTFLISEDAGVYSGFDDFWLRMDNTQEDDGWYVFRDAEHLGVEYVAVNASGG